MSTLMWYVWGGFCKNINRILSLGESLPTLILITVKIGIYMKYCLSGILILGLVFGCSQSNESNHGSIQQGPLPHSESAKSTNKTKNDTLTIVNSEWTEEPFSLGPDPLSKLISFGNIQLDWEPIKNRHVENQIDTVYRISMKRDFFEVYKARSQNWITKAMVRSDHFQSDRGIKVGMTKTKMKKKLNLTMDELPDYIRLKSQEVEQWVVYKFESDTLLSINFRGYLD
ncbi:MAG TPA: hypothetical protein VKZ54_05345 [Membranihabitans sp.]|nr:hypothetical protein [Membranihabitans sp.]